MSFDADKFFREIRDQYGRLDQTQVDSLNAILGATSELKREWRAYILATARHESRWRPVREGFTDSDAQARRVVRNRTYGKPDPPTGNVYYGRGFVQLTWKENYAKAGAKLHIGGALVANPDKVLDPAIACRILTQGMIEGWFTGRRLEQYQTRDGYDYFNARRIVNRLDKAGLIAGYARTIADILERCGGQ